MGEALSSQGPQEWDAELEGKKFLAAWKRLSGCPEDERIEDWIAAQHDAYSSEFGKEGEENGKPKSSTE